MILVAAVAFSGCTEEAPPAPVPVVTYAPGQVLYTTGEVTGQGITGGQLATGTIDTITFSVGLVPCARSVDMEMLTIVYADAVRSETLIPVQGYRGNPPQGSWGILDVQNEIGGQNNRLDDKELFTIRINPRAPLVPRQLITIGIKPEEGPTLTLRRVSPSTILAENNILAPV